MKAWHWVNSTLRDGSPVPPDGEKLIYDGEIELCKTGYHASVDLWDALMFAPGGTLCRVEVGGKIIRDEDKLVATERTILWRLDADGLLRTFARLCALDVVHLWDAPDVVVQFLRTGDEGLRDAARYASRDVTRYAARYAARDVTRYAARDAARAAAKDAAWAAARDASRAAARDAARAAAKDASRAAARDAARAAAKDAKRAAAKDAAWAAAKDAAKDAAWAAAKDAAKKRQSSRLYRLVMDARRGVSDG